MLVNGSIASLSCPSDLRPSAPVVSMHHLSVMAEGMFKSIKNKEEKKGKNKSSTQFSC